MTKTIEYVICYPNRSPLITLTKTDEDGSYTISKPCDSAAVCEAAEALFAALVTETNASLPIVPVIETPSA